MQKRMTASGPSDVTGARVTGGARGRNTPAASGCSRPRKRPLRALHAATPASPPARNSCVRLNPRVCGAWRILFSSPFTCKDSQQQPPRRRSHFFSGRALLNHVHSQRVGGGFTPCDARASTFIRFHSDRPGRRLLLLSALVPAARGAENSPRLFVSLIDNRHLMRVTFAAY